MPASSLDALPGYRRRFRVTAGEGWVRSEVEDDYHHMRVTLRHDGAVVTAVEPEMVRAPWTTCPGAVEQLKATFTGVPLDGVAARGEKPSNCTHLHDLAVLAAAHVADAEPLQYDILVSDPIDGRNRAELRRNGAAVMRWGLVDGQVAEPAEIAGTPLLKMGSWINALAPAEQEFARLLRWGAVVAHGRAIPLEQQSDARRMPPNCYTFQPDRAVRARRVGEIRDFSGGVEEPLEPRKATFSPPANASQSYNHS